MLSHPSTDPVRGQLVWHQRIVLVVLSCALVALLLTATVLTPDSAGWGTHQQLGLPPCSFRSSLGIRCPACGMTTAWAHYVRGQIVQAVTVNTGGTLLALVATIAAAWSLISGCSGRQYGARPLVYGVMAGSVIVVVVLLEWGVRLLHL